jgi:NCK-associated protein 1
MVCLVLQVQFLGLYMCTCVRNCYICNFVMSWQVIEDLMTFREQVLRVIMDLGSTVVTLLPNQNPLLLSVFMDLFCGFVRVNLLADKVPCKMLLQTYNLTHTMMKSGRDYGAYHRMVQFLDSYDPPLRGLQDDLNFVSPRIGEVCAPLNYSC